MPTAKGNFVWIIMKKNGTDPYFPILIYSSRKKAIKRLREQEEDLRKSDITVKWSSNKDIGFSGAGFAEGFAYKVVQWYVN